LTILAEKKEVFVTEDLKPIPLRLTKELRDMLDYIKYRCPGKEGLKANVIRGILEKELPKIVHELKEEEVTGRSRKQYDNFFPR